MLDIKQKVLRGGLAKLCGQAANSALRLGFLAVLAQTLTRKTSGSSPW